jgi:hypothetical protein
LLGIAAALLAVIHTLFTCETRQRKCQWHSSKIKDAETQAELLKLAAEYIAQADQAPESAN